jgi:hypothetical protein
MTIDYPLILDRTRGRLVCRPGARAVIHLDDEGCLPRESARTALYVALLDGRCKVPGQLYRELQLESAEPRVIKPGSL